MKKKQLLPLGILAILILAALIYTRPMTLKESCVGWISRRVRRCTPIPIRSLPKRIRPRAWTTQYGCAVRSAQRL